MRKTNGGIAQKLAKLQQREGLLPLETLSYGYTATLEEALTDLAEIASKINVVEMVTAVNHNAERDRWLEQARQGKFTIPKLQYNRDLLQEVSSNYDRLTNAVAPKLRLAQALLSNDAVGNTLRGLSQARLQNVTAAVNLAESLLKGKAIEATRQITALYGLPNSHSLQQARQAIEDRKAGKIPRCKKIMLTESGRQQLQAIKLDAEAVRQIFLWAAKEYGFSVMRPVVVSNQVTAPDVRDVSSEGSIVVIPVDYQTNGLDVVPLTVHEVGCHWRDSENMQRLLPLLGGGNLKPMDELLYEGHAVAEGTKTKLRLQGFMRPRRQLYYPIAIRLAYQKQLMFHETAQELLKIIRSDDEPLEQTLDDVWRVTYRVYRGNPHLEVRNGYAYTKDRAYFGGKVLAEELEQAGVGHLLEYGTLTLSDLTLLASQFDLHPAAGMPFPDDPLLAERLCEKLLRGEFGTAKS